MTSKHHLVFVYGSLKSGYPNHRVLKNSQRVMGAVTEDDYVMIDLGAFPGVVKFWDGVKRGPVKGEVYRVTDDVFEDLDALEANGYLYQRELVKVKDFEQPVWMYIYLNGFGGSDIVEIDNGLYDW